MNIELIIKNAVLDAIKSLYGAEVNEAQVQIQQTRKDFEGDKTVVVFPFLRTSRKSPEVTGEEIGNYIVESVPMIEAFNVIKGFLNLTISKSVWVDILKAINSDDLYGYKSVTDDSKTVMVEYSSPNTNKPLHLGHIRNNLLGYSISRILEANGNKVVKTNIVNDRGIHICKSIYAWQQFGNGETPESSGKKGDKLVGDYYVKFDKNYKEEIAKLVAEGVSEDDAKEQAPSMIATRELLLKWEAKDPEVYELWKTMNSWVYKGFDVTYNRLGVSFDKIYYESDTYLTGKDEVLRGLKEGIFYQREDGSVWADLSKDGLDEKILLRSDGTSVYMTQDIGTAQLRFEDYPIDHMVYVVGNEQIYHFQVLSMLLDKLGYKWGKDLYHFSYGMVELPQGKMKSREGTVVDADDLMDEMVAVAKSMSEELGKLDNFTDEEKNQVYHTVALGALKYFMLKVDPKKGMMFDPKESIDFNGNTGPFIQYTYARINSLVRKAKESGVVIPDTVPDVVPNSAEIELIKSVSRFEEVLEEAGRNHSPAVIANYVYDLVKEFNRYYHEFSILKEDNESVKQLRLIVAQNVAKTVKNGFALLGIDVPSRM